MGAKVVVGEGESLEQAIRRLKKQIRQGNRWPVFRPKPTKRRLDYYETPGQLKRRRAVLAKLRRQWNLNALANLCASPGERRVRFVPMPRTES